ncbi:MAG: serine/threonine protein kinase [Polyangiaceae bacterium]|nr:serine/threonine protein kinase [Polyangiaceae bacterium]
MNAWGMERVGHETTATFRLKALLLCLRAKYGARAAKEFTRRVRCGPVFDDETRPIATLLWVRALAEFEDICGQEAFEQLPEFFVHPNNLGAWGPMLSGSMTPQEFWDRASYYSSHSSPRSQLEQISSLRAKVTFLLPRGLPVSDQRRVLRALCAEVQSLPLLMSPNVGKLELQGDVSGGQVSGILSWRAPGRATTGYGVLLTAAILILGWSVLERAGVNRLETFRTLFLILLVGSTATYVVWREARARSRTSFNRKKIFALERANLLSVSRSHEISRPHQEPVLGGMYRLDSPLGSGGHATVWGAQRLLDNQPVAVKLLRTGSASEPRAIERMKRESEAIVKVHHPNVVEVLDSGHLSSGVPYLVMERLVGETISERVSRRGALSFSEVMTVGTQAAAALDAMHRAGIVHRDIKPDNLFVSGGDDLQLKVIDFGAAWMMGAGGYERELGVVGTKGFAAPEQIDGEPPFPTADIYALGVSLRTLLQGKPPFETQSLEQFAEERLTSSDVDELSPRRIELRVAELILKMTVAEPEERIESAQHVAQEFARYLKLWRELKEKQRLPSASRLSSDGEFA